LKAQRLHQEQYQAMRKNITTRIAAMGVEFPQPEGRTIANIQFEFESM